MKQTLKIGMYSFRDVSRNMWLVTYTCFFALVTIGLFQFHNNSEKVAISITSVCLVLIPLVSVLFGAMHFYNLREFTELILTQPVKRSTVFRGSYLGLTFALVLGFLLGVGAPYIVFSFGKSMQVSALLTLLIVGVCMTIIFVALSFLIASRFDDRGKGIAIALGVWLVTAILYDGFVLYLATAFSEYPLEKPLLALSIINPIDLARVLLLVQSDVAALMGYTGAVFNRFFGTALGVSIAAASLIIWMVIPFRFGRRIFLRKDF